MKTKYWIVIFGSLAVVLAICAALLIPRGNAQAVEVWSEGKLLHTLPLSEERELVIATDRGSNTVVIKDGKAFVSHADCPDKTCVSQGKRTAGQIVCLPNRLVLKFIGKQQVDGVAG